MHTSSPTTTSNRPAAGIRVTSSTRLLRPAAIAFAVVGVSLLGSACGVEQSDAGTELPAPSPSASSPTTAATSTSSVSEGSGDIDVEAEPVGRIAVEVLKLGRLDFGSPFKSDVGFRVEALDTDVDPFSGHTDAEDSVSIEVAPGDYRVVVDRADLGPGPCDGSYEATVTVSVDEETTVIAYSVEDGAEQFGIPSCVSVQALPLPGSLPETFDEDPVLRAVDDVSAADGSIGSLPVVDVTAD